MKALQLTYEAERQRQHARYRIPAIAEINGTRFVVANWSVGGFCVENFHSSAALPETFPTTLRFQFQSFELALDVQAELQRRVTDSEGDTIGCRFTGIDQHQRSQLQYVANAFLSGEIVSTGDVLHVVSREDLNQVQRALQITQQKTLGTRMKRFAGLGLTTLAGIALFGFIADTVFNRVFVVDALSGVVDAPIVVVRSPQPGYFEPFGGGSGNNVSAGEPLAAVELIGGGATTLDSPCNCNIIEYHARSREFAALGEPLITLLPEKTGTEILAEVFIADFQRIAIGDPATIRFPDRRELAGRVLRVQHVTTPEQDRSTQLQSPPANPLTYGHVVVAPNEPVNVRFLGTPVSVRINTFRALAAFSDRTKAFPTNVARADSGRPPIPEER